MSLRERDGALINNWYVACLSRELGTKKPLQRVLYDEPFVLFRNKEGKVACLPDRCLHRHTQLSQGDVFDGCIGCPYHGWTYNSDGLVVDIPSEGPRFSKDPARKLNPVPAVEQDGCIWIWLGSEKPSTALPPFRFPNLKAKEWSHYFMITDFENEVTHLAENFVDVPHTVFVHKGWFRRQTKTKIKISVKIADAKVLTTYLQPNDSIGFTSRLINPKNEPMVHTDCFLLPNITKVDYQFGERHAFTIISQCSPVSTLKTRVYTAIIYKMGFLNWLFFPFFRFYTRVVIEQDVRIMKNQGDNFRRKMSEDFVSTNADVIHEGVEKLRALAKEGSPSASSYKESLERDIWI